jgi:hypothetical protein
MAISESLSRRDKSLQLVNKDVRLCPAVLVSRLACAICGGWAHCSPVQQRPHADAGSREASRAPPYPRRLSSPRICPEQRSNGRTIRPAPRSYPHACKLENTDRARRSTSAGRGGGRRKRARLTPSQAQAPAGSSGSSSPPPQQVRRSVPFLVDD